MRRHVRIFVEFTRRSGHPHPRLEAALGNYGSLLGTLGWTDEEIQAELASLTEADE